VKSFHKRGSAKTDRPKKKRQNIRSQDQKPERGKHSFKLPSRTCRKYNSLIEKL
jgi:hypothetical protein